MAITTAMSTSFKQELMQAGHNFSAQVTPTLSATSGSVTCTSVSSLANVSVGAAVTGTSIASNTVVARVLSSTSIELSKATTGAISTGTVTISPDVFMVALFKSGLSGTYGAANTNYSDMGSDELSTGGGYTATGQSLTNSGVSTSGTTAYTTFASNPSWSSATFSTAGCMVYNSSTRLSSSGRCVGVYDFGGSQVVSSGVFTITLPSATSSTAIIRVA